MALVDPHMHTPINGEGFPAPGRTWMQNAWISAIFAMPVGHIDMSLLPPQGVVLVQVVCACLTADCAPLIVLCPFSGVDCCPARGGAITEDANMFPLRVEERSYFLDGPNHTIHVQLKLPSFYLPLVGLNLSLAPCPLPMPL